MTDLAAPTCAVTRRSGALVGLLFFYALIAPSPIWPALGIRGFVLLGLTVVATFAILLNQRRKLRLGFMPMAALAFVLAMVPAAYWAAPLLTIYPIFFVSAAILVSQLSVPERVWFVELATRFMMILLVGAVVGYAIAALGIQPLTTIENTDGRTNYFFYTTFSNVYEQGFIRPSGLYDEPGALSFFVCMTAYLREATGRTRATTLTLLILGFITFSVMHLIFFVLYLLATQRNLRVFLRLFAVSGSLVAALFVSGGGQVIQDRFLARLEVNDDGSIAGDTRSLLILNAISVLTRESQAALMGADSDCSLNTGACLDKFGPMGENALSPLVSQGLFISWPYYLLLLAGLWALTRGRRGLIFFAVALLFFQRPYLLNLGYASVGCLAAWLHLNPIAPLRAVTSQPAVDGPRSSGAPPLLS